MFKLTFWSSKNTLMSVILPSMAVAIQIWRSIPRNAICVTRESDGAMLLSWRYPTDGAYAPEGQGV